MSDKHNEAEKMTKTEIEKMHQGHESMTKQVTALQRVMVDMG
jgi:hypothetical protein